MQEIYAGLRMTCWSDRRRGGGAEAVKKTDRDVGGRTVRIWNRVVLVQWEML